MVLSIGYGRQMFESTNSERKRMDICAAEVSELHMIIFTLKSDNCLITHGDNGLTIYPTNSKNKASMVWDAYKIGSKIISQHSQKIIVTSQDPFEAGLVGFFLKKRFRVHFTIQEHADVFKQRFWRTESFLNRFRYQIGLFLLTQADTIRTVSDRIERKIRSLNLKANITKLPVAINLEEFSRYKKESIENGDTFDFVTMARFVKQKNLTLLLNSFYKVWQVCPQARLTIVGRGPLENQLKFIVKDQYHEDPPVKFIDWTSRPGELMGRADAYVLSSNYEGWGRVLIEAALMKLPIVTTDVGCVGEVILNNKHCLSVPVNDETALAQAMTEIAVNKEKYNQIKEHLNNFDKENLSNMLLDDYGKRWAQSLI